MSSDSNDEYRESLRAKYEMSEASKEIQRGLVLGYIMTIIHFALAILVILAGGPPMLVALIASIIWPLLIVYCLWSVYVLSWKWMWAWHPPFFQIGGLLMVNVGIGLMNVFIIINDMVE